MHLKRYYPKEHPSLPANEEEPTQPEPGASKYRSLERELEFEITV